MLKNDYILKQIKNFIKFLKKLFKINTDDYSFISEDMMILDAKLSKLLNKGFINEAEDLLFDSRSDIDEYIVVVIKFYEKLSNMSEAELRKFDFSREEIKEGLGEITKKLNLPIELFLNK